MMKEKNCQIKNEHGLVAFIYMGIIPTLVIIPFIYTHIYNAFIYMGIVPTLVIMPILVTRGHNVLIRDGLSTSMPLIIGFELNLAMIGGVEISPV